jgi:prophage regulatory protein
MPTDADGLLKTPATRILREVEVVERVGLSADLIAQLEARGQFPRRVPLTSRRVGWVESEIERWIQARVADRDDAEREAQLRFDRAPPAVRHRLRRERETAEPPPA